MINKKINKKKKAVSPLIAWVLLIGFTITMAAFITTFTINRIKSLDIEGSAEVELYCGDVQLRLAELCRTSNTSLKVDLINSGLFNIHKLSIQLDSSFQPLKTDSIYFITPIPPQEKILHTIELKEVDGRGDHIRSLTIVPWVVVQDEDDKINEIACSDKKISFDDDTNVWLNKFCCEPDPNTNNICCTGTCNNPSNSNIPGCGQGGVCCQESECT